MSDDLREVISPEAIGERIAEMGREISADYQGKDLVLIGILKGAFIFTADLARAMSIPVEIDFVRLASYGSSTSSSGFVRITKDIETDIRGRHVLVVEDIVDTGHTLKYLQDVLALHGPASVKICCLIDKKERREVEIAVDYVGFDVPRGFLVGYGLDYNEAYRHLPGIYHLTPRCEPKGFRPSER